MASPHAAGVAALIRDAFPNLSGSAVAAMLLSSASPLPCPANDDRCVGGAGQNSFFGNGMVNAEEAVH